MRNILSVTGLLLAASLATAETIDEQQATLGWQTENAPLVARVTHRSEQPVQGDKLRATFEVVEVLRGGVTEGAEIRVIHHDGGHGTPWTDGGEHLVFLRPAEDGTYTSVSGTLGIRRLPVEGPERRFVDIVSDYLTTLDDDGVVRDPDRLRELLVGWMGDRDPGVVWSAAIDFHRHAELHEGLSAAQRVAILEAYRTHPIGKASKRALAHALADARPLGAVGALLDTLAEPGARPLRGDIAEALAAIGSPLAVSRSLSGLESEWPELREHLLVVLGALGDGSAAPAVRVCLADESRAVRVQAAHALGLIARAVRADDPEARVAGRTELVAMIATARTVRERKAGTWALAQLDQPQAYAQLRRMAKSDPDSDVRRFAARYLKTPRVSLIL